ncbi:hypothetical protein BaRGS_00002157 [Batillaria attramentaria]|uniref:Uncharacterized protein n=1 Tax=Batillaria attramentaria TaxID=370345 RepID=A0ABD0M5X9_9CAEN
MSKQEADPPPCLDLSVCPQRAAKLWRLMKKAPIGGVLRRACPRAIHNLARGPQGGGPGTTPEMQLCAPINMVNVVAGSSDDGGHQI